MRLHVAEGQLTDQGYTRLPMGTATYARSVSGVWLMGMLASLALICVVTGVWFIGKTLYNWIETNALNQSSVPGVATVIAVESVAPSEAGLTRHYVTYRFDAIGKDGATETFVRQAEILNTRNSGPPVNSQIRIRYSPSAPNISRIEGEDENKFEGWLLYGLFTLLVLLCIPFAGLLLLGFYRSLRMTRHAQRLRYAGVSTTGTVLHVWGKEGDEYETAYYMAYRFSAPAGNGELQTVELKQQIKSASAAWLRPGETVVVRYEASAPTNATAEVD
jgi:hypothetical protein